MHSFVEPQEDHISAYTHDQGFLPNGRPVYEGREVSRSSWSQQGLRPPTPKFSQDEYIATKLPIYSPKRQSFPSITKDDHHDDSACRERSDRDMYKSWGTRHDFMRSHGLKPGAYKSYKEASELLDQYRELDARSTFKDREHNNRQPSDRYSSRNIYGTSLSDNSDLDYQNQSNHRNERKESTTYEQADKIPHQYQDRDYNHQHICSGRHDHNTRNNSNYDSGFLHPSTLFPLSAASDAFSIADSSRADSRACGALETRTRYESDYASGGDFDFDSDSEYVARYAYTAGTGFGAGHGGSERGIGNGSDVVWDSDDCWRSDVGIVIGSEEGGERGYGRAFYSGNEGDEDDYEDEYGFDDWVSCVWELGERERVGFGI